MKACLTTSMIMFVAQGYDIFDRGIVKIHHCDRMIALFSWSDTKALFSLGETAIYSGSTSWATVVLGKIRTPLALR